MVVTPTDDLSTGGYKSTISSELDVFELLFAPFVHFCSLTYADPRNSAAAKQHAREILNAAGIAEDEYEFDEESGYSRGRRGGQTGVGTGHGEDHNIRVIAGYKAALKSECFFSAMLFQIII